MYFKKKIESRISRGKNQRAEINERKNFENVKKANFNINTTDKSLAKIIK